MVRFVEGGHLVEVILAFIAIEVVFLLILKRGGRLPRLRVTRLGAQLSAGVFLLLAVRSAQLEAPWWQVLTFLGLSLPAHLVDLVLRYSDIGAASSEVG